MLSSTHLWYAQNCILKGVGGRAFGVDVHTCRSIIDHLHIVTQPLNSWHRFTAHPNVKSKLFPVLLHVKVCQAVALDERRYVLVHGCDIF